MKIPSGMTMITVNGGNKQQKNQETTIRPKK